MSTIKTQGTTIQLLLHLTALAYSTCAFHSSLCRIILLLIARSYHNWSCMRHSEQGFPLLLPSAVFLAPAAEAVDFRRWRKISTHSLDCLYNGLRSVPWQLPQSALHIKKSNKYQATVSNVNTHREDTFSL